MIYIYIYIKSAKNVSDNIGESVYKFEGHGSVPQQNKKEEGMRQNKLFKKGLALALAVFLGIPNMGGGGITAIAKEKESRATATYPESTKFARAIELEHIKPTQSGNFLDNVFDTPLLIM